MNRCSGIRILKHLPQIHEQNKVPWNYVGAPREEGAPISYENSGTFVFISREYVLKAEQLSKVAGRGIHHQEQRGNGEQYRAVNRLPG
jgi:ribosomal protein L7Ae-like RNA K-turn-binding protein